MDTQEIRDIFGRNLRYYRFHRQFSQAALAEKAEISITFLSNIERGKMFPKVETLSRLTESLNVDVAELFRTDIVPKDQKELINRFSQDLKSKITSALDEVFNYYL